MAISPTDIQILFTNYHIIMYFLNLAFCSKHFISIKHPILATFNINKKINSDSLYALKKTLPNRYCMTNPPPILFIFWSNRGTDLIVKISRSTNCPYMVIFIHQLDINTNVFSPSNHQVNKDST